MSSLPSPSPLKPAFRRSIRESSPARLQSSWPRWDRFWRRLLRSSPRKSRDDDDALPLLVWSDPPQNQTHRHTHTHRHRQRRSSRLRLARCLVYPVVGFFVMLGIVQFISIACAIIVSYYFPDDLDRAALRWRDPHRNLAQSQHPSWHWPTDVSRDIIPVPCHSHNDYWRPVPLYAALQAGCISVEADVWSLDLHQHNHHHEHEHEHDHDLYVGHTQSALTPARTLKSMYIDPLVAILEQQNPITSLHPARDDPPHGVFDTSPSQTLILLIDFKTDGDGMQTWNHVHAQLSPLRERGYLAHFNGSHVVNGPVTVVATGNAPLNTTLHSPTTHRDIFLDAPLDNLAAAEASSNIPFTPSNSYYASTSFKKSIGTPWSSFFVLREPQLAKIRAQVNAAHLRGLKARYWALPSWPRSFRNYIWAVLVREGVDVLNVDDLRDATRGEWRFRVGDLWGW